MEGRRGMRRSSVMEHTQLFRSVLEVWARELIPRADIVGTDDVYAKLFVPYTYDRKACVRIFRASQSHFHKYTQYPTPSSTATYRLTSLLDR
jgi:hypothetical protein